MDFATWPHHYLSVKLLRASGWEHQLWRGAISFSWGLHTHTQISNRSIYHINMNSNKRIIHNAPSELRASRFIYKKRTTYSKRMRRAWKTMGPPPRTMPQCWTAHRSSLTRGLWPSEAQWGRGLRTMPRTMPKRCPVGWSHTCQAHLGQAACPARHISKRDAARPQPHDAN